MKIYITGIAGFLGSHLAKRLVDLGHEVSGNDSMVQGELDNLPKNINFHKIDCCNYEEMSKNLKSMDIVYHCAATAHEGLSVFSPIEITKNNYLASITIFTSAIKNKVKITVTIEALKAAPKSKVIKCVIGGGEETTPLNFPKPVTQAIALNTIIPIIMFPLIFIFSITIIETNAPAPKSNSGLERSPSCTKTTGLSVVSPII